MPDSLIKIDQSHCNYSLSTALAPDGWDVIFRDPGRATRGRTGLQADVHAIFVRNGWPIPDIVAWKYSSVLIVEVEHSYRRCKPSLLRYAEDEKRILTELNSLPIASAFDQLLLGFCKIGAERNVQPIFAEGLVTLIGSFVSPDPTLYWA